MGVEKGEPKGRWHLEMGVLRWAAIVLPILFLVLLEILRHTVFADQIDSFPGLVIVLTVMVVAVVVFSYAIFGFISRLEQRIIDQNRQLSALNNIAKAAAGRLKLEALLDASLDPILTNLGADAGLICIVDLEEEEHSVVCYRGFSPEVVGKMKRAKLKDYPIAQQVIRTGRPVIRERIFDDPEVSEATRRSGFKSAISAPLMSEGEVNGILAIATRRERKFSKGDREFLESIGGQLGLAIRNATLYEQSQLQNRELGALLAVGKEVTSSFDLDELLRVSLDTILEVTSADAAEIWLVEDDEEVVMRCHRGEYTGAFLEKTSFRFGEGIPGIVVQTQEPILIPDISSDVRFLRHGVVEAGFHTFCALPLGYKGKPMGALAVAALSPDSIKSPRELRVLEGIGEWLALAIENTRLYRQVQDVAVLQERERIAREMHDGMAQLLGYINTQTMAVKKLLSNEQITDAREELTSMEEIARDLYADVREAILGLRTGASGKDGIVAVLREYAEHYVEMSGIDVEVNSDDAKYAQLPSSVEIQLIRIVQEALTNVRKHSKATAARVTFERDGSGLRVTISDNGQGFDPMRLPSRRWPRFGLQTMRERAEAIGGTLNIDTEPGQGTRIKVHIPLSHEP